MRSSVEVLLKFLSIRFTHDCVRNASKFQSIFFPKWKNSYEDLRTLFSLRKTFVPLEKTTATKITLFSTLLANAVQHWKCFQNKNSNRIAYALNGTHQQKRKRIPVLISHSNVISVNPYLQKFIHFDFKRCYQLAVIILKLRWAAWNRWQNVKAELIMFVVDGNMQSV